MAQTTDANTDVEFDKPITQAVQAGSKRKCADHDSAKYVAQSGVEETDDEGSDPNIYTSNIHTHAVKEPCVTTMVCTSLFVQSCC